MPIVIAIEGMDGAGKSAVATEIGHLCGNAGLTWAIIRSDAPATLEITRKLADRTALSSSRAEAELRVARDEIRAELVRSGREDVVILDRFVVSTFARIKGAGLPMEDYTETLVRICLRSGLRATVLVACHHRVAWKRVVSRAGTGEKPLSPDEALGPAHHRRIGQIITAACRDKRLSVRTLVLQSERELRRTMAYLPIAVMPFLVGAYNDGL